MSLRQRGLRRLALLVASTGIAACTLRPEPLRAGWLRSGVYAQPPPPACAPPKAPGVPFEELSRWSLPSFDVHVAAQLTLPWVGPFTANVQGAGAQGPRHRVSSRSTQPMRIVEELARQFVRGQVCSGARGVRGQLLRAMRDGPDVVVVLTDGDIQRRRHNDYERMYEECHVAPSYLYCYVDEATELVDMNRIADGARLPPVIAVSVKRHGARWLQNLAEATGGAFVDVAP